ncbi:MAG: transposase [bacterium]|nr:transposase [bacterium]
METLREKYLGSHKKEKGRILDEYCRNTGQERKYVIKKFRYKAKLKQKGSARKARKEYYDGYVRSALARLWTIFDYPCGQRLAPLLKDESAKLRALGEVEFSNETLFKLQRITPSTIDTKLAHEKEVLMNKRKYASKRNFLIASKVPTKTSAEQDRSTPGQEQIDCVEHCGTCAAGDYVHTLSVVDIFSGWWEGEAIMGKGQERALFSINEAKKRSPFAWREIHPDNGGNILNIHVYNYAEKHGITMSRSRPYKKNDNCFVEQKNSTHVRQVVGYLRYDTPEEQTIMNGLYRNELRLYKNFFQPVMKLASKERIHGKIHKKQGKAMTPFKRLMESPAVPEGTKAQLQKLYASLNPAELKRNIDTKLSRLYRAHQKKKGLSVETSPNTRKSSVTYGVKIYHSTDTVSVS